MVGPVVAVLGVLGVFGTFGVGTVVGGLLAAVVAFFELLEPQPAAISATATVMAVAQLNLLLIN